MLAPITPPPGVITNGTEYSQRGRWVDSDLIRWVEGIAHPVGGWERFISTAVSGTPLKAFAYSRNSGIPALVIGTTTGIYYYDGSLTDITPDGFVAPAENDNTGYGWGASGYSDEEYGTERSETGLYPPIYHYFFDSWGDELIACCNSDGKVYKYGTGDAKMQLIANAPTSCAGMVVTDERFVVAFGADGDFNRVEWCDREDYTTWTPAPTNLAGGQNINSSAKIIDAVKWRGQIIIYTSSDIHVMRYLGAPLVYGFSKVSSCSAPVSPRATVASSAAVVWVTHGGIMRYDGSLTPVPCPVWDFFKEDLNMEAIGAVCGGHNSFNDEIWWFFPTGDSQAPNRCGIWNYTEGIWSVGYMGRSAWVDSGAFRFPLALTTSGVIVQHESIALNLSYGIGARKPYLESAPMDVADGNDVIMVHRLIPDEAFVNPDGLVYELTGQMFPGCDSEEFGPYEMSSGKIDCRASARQFKVTITGPTDRDFGIGTLRADITKRGKR